MLSDQDLRHLAAFMCQFGIGILELEQPGQRLRLQVSPDAAALQAPSEAGLADALDMVKAPSMGVFRHSHPDGLFARCQVGASVEPSQILAFLQSDLLLTPVVSSTAGRITEILMADGSIVGYGTPLFKLGHGAP